MIFVGNDWAEGHHDVYLMDDDGARPGFVRLPEGIQGIARFHEMVAGHVSEPAEVVVGIETDRGLWVGALVGAGYQVYAINPMAVSRYRDRHSQGGAKSDRGDAKVLADWYAPTVTTTVGLPVTAPEPKASKSWLGRIRT